MYKTVLHESHQKVMMQPNILWRILFSEGFSEQLLTVIVKIVHQLNWLFLLCKRSSFLSIGGTHNETNTSSNICNLRHGNYDNRIQRLGWVGTNLMTSKKRQKLERKIHKQKKVIKHVRREWRDVWTDYCAELSKVAKLEKEIENYKSTLRRYENEIK